MLRIRDVYPGSPIRIFLSRIQGSNKHRIPDPDPQHGNIVRLSGGTKAILMNVWSNLKFSNKYQCHYKALKQRMPATKDTIQFRGRAATLCQCVEELNEDARLFFLLLSYSCPPIPFRPRPPSCHGQCSSIPLLFITLFSLCVAGAILPVPGYGRGGK